MKKFFENEPELAFACCLFAMLFALTIVFGVFTLLEHILVRACAV